MKFLILILQILFIQIFSVIIFPFKRKIQSLNNFYEYLYQNDLISEIIIGTPEQKIEIIIKGEEHPFYISKINVLYNVNLSSTYKKISNEEKEINYESFNKFFISSETFEIKNHKNEIIKINNFPFIYATNTENPSLLNSAIIGLFYKDYITVKEIKDFNLITLLKKNNISNNYVFSIDYNDLNKGTLYLGDNFYNFNSSFQKSNFIQINPIFQGIGYAWGNEFDYISYNNIILDDSNYKFYFNFTFPGIFGTKNFEKILLNDFFDSNLCQKNDIEKEKFHFYICNKDFNYKKFKDLIFYHKELNTSFILTYKDLFIEENDKIYCLIVFRDYNYNTWFLGEPFIKKYKFSFEQDNRLIGFYKLIISENNNFNIFSFNFIFIIILIILCIGLTILLIRNIINKPRKLRANELEDNFEYITKI